MASNNIAFIATGEVLGINTTVGILIETNKKLLFAKISNEKHDLKDVITSTDLSLPKKATDLSVFDNKSLLFTASLTYTTHLNNNTNESSYGFDLLMNLKRKVGNQTKVKENTLSKYEYHKFVCHAFKTSENIQLAVMMESAFLSEKNTFESSVKSVLDFLSIETLILIIRQKALNQSDYEYFIAQAIPAGFPAEGIQGYNSELFIANARFTLIGDKASSFARGIHALSGMEYIDLFIKAKGLNDISALLIHKKPLYEQDGITPINKFKNSNFYLDEISINVNTSKLAVRGKISLSLRKEEFTFELSSILTLNSFLLSASSTGVFEFNKNIQFSDLKLMIGVVTSGPTFGMTGRVTYIPTSGQANEISIFGGFIISAYNVPLITCALTASKGKISLRDVIVDIAEITLLDVGCLDQISIGDFQFESGNSENQIYKFDNWSGRQPSDGETYENIDALRLKIHSEFNALMPSIFQVTEQANFEVQYLGNELTIITDKYNMRHFRVSKNGDVSLSCQMYACTEQIGDYQVGYFICGTLEILGIKARALFYLEPSKCAIAVFQISKIDIHGIFVLDQSSKVIQTNIKAKDGGKNVNSLLPEHLNGPTVYFYLDPSLNRYEFFVSINLKLLTILEVDVLVYIDTQFVKISFCVELLGFNISLILEAEYASFSNKSFIAHLHFDSLAFQEKIENARKHINRFIEAQQKVVDTAQQSLSKAMDTVNSLDSQIKNLHSDIQKCRKKISRWHPFDSAVAIAKITSFEVAILSLEASKNIALGALKLAQLAVSGGAAIAENTLNVINKMISSVTEIILLKSFDIILTFSQDLAKIEASLELQLLGKTIPWKGDIELSFIQNLLLENRDKPKDELMSEVERLMTLDENRQEFSHKIYEFSENIVTKTDEELDKLNKENNALKKANFRIKIGNWNHNITDLGTELKEYQDGVDFQQGLESFVYALCKAYLEEFGELPTNWEEQVTSFVVASEMARSFRSHSVQTLIERLPDNMGDVLEYIQNNRNLLKLPINDAEREELKKYIQDVADFKKQHTFFKHDSQSSKGLYDRINSLNKVREGTHFNNQNNSQLADMNSSISLEKLSQIIDKTSAKIHINDNNPIEEHFYERISELTQDIKS